MSVRIDQHLKKYNQELTDGLYRGCRQSLEDLQGGKGDEGKCVPE